MLGVIQLVGGRFQLVQVGPKLTATLLYLKFARQCVRVSRLLSNRGALMLRRAENDSRCALAATVAGMRLHRESHRSGEHEQGHNATEKPLQQGKLHAGKDTKRTAEARTI